MSHTFTVTISDEEYSAFGKVVLDPDAWAENAVTNKSRKCVLRVVEETLRDSDNLLTIADQDLLHAAIQNQNLALKPWKRWPTNILRKIADASLILTRAEREAQELPQPQKDGE